MLSEELLKFANAFQSFLQEIAGHFLLFFLQAVQCVQCFRTAQLLHALRQTIYQFLPFSSKRVVCA
jgi:hypothetical protein